ncbi:MAG TPA: hypothetical protein VL977_00740, partial [Solirubrobacteraceae bacterium]|nr:hypothetical protein [Solirubrobacteraceae bacterium]
RTSAAALLDRAGPEGGRALVTGGGHGRARTSGAEPSAPTKGADRLIQRIHGDDSAAELSRALLHDAWVVESIEALPEAFAGLAVTRSGRVWSPATGELRQAAAVGEDRVLAERNRREQLIGASEQAAGAEQLAKRELEAAGVRLAGFDREREQAIAGHRQAVRGRDEAAEERRRLLEAIARRREAPDEGPAAARRAQLQAELAAERAQVERAARERAQRLARLDQLRAAIERDERIGPVIEGLRAALAAAAGAIEAARSEFEAALAADREAGEHVAAELRSCAQQEAGLQTSLQAENERLTGLEVRAQRSRDQATDATAALAALAAELQLEPEAGQEPLGDDALQTLRLRLERLERRREQLGPVNPLAQAEYAEAIEHVEQLELQRTDLETAMRELEGLIRDTDRQIRETFEETFAAAARNFEELVQRLFPGGSGRLRLVAERDGQAPVLGGEAPQSAEADDEDERDDAGDEDLVGVEIEITPAGKAMKRLTLLSGGEKSMTALAFLFSVFLARPCPFYILDEVEAALDDLNIDRFLDLLAGYSERAQFIVVTHQKRTMEAADSLYGVSMGGDGISKVISRRLPAREAA